MMRFGFEHPFGPGWRFRIGKRHIIEWTPPPPGSDGWSFCIHKLLR